MKRIMIVCLAMIAVAVYQPVWAGEKPTVGSILVKTVSQEHFDQRLDALHAAVSDVKGDTSQIVAILGNVFEGTVPKGGTLTRLCDEKGWSLVVLMGHNNIVDPNTVSAGAVFLYPKNTEEFQAALVKGKSLYDDWLKAQKVTFRVNRIEADTVEIDTLTARIVHITEQMKVKEMDIDHLKVRLAEITEELRIKKAEIEELNIDKLNIKDANIDKLRIKELEIGNLQELLKQAQGRVAELEARPPEVRTVVQYRNVSPSLGAVTCDDRPWSATGIWEDFPEGAVGTESLSRQNDTHRYKYKLVTRKDGMILALQCFKSDERLSLGDLATKWSKDIGIFEDFGTGDGGTHNTLQIGIMKNHQDQTEEVAPLLEPLSQEDAV